MTGKTCDAAVIGAGISGLAAAHFLNKFSAETEVIILEQDSRPGGAIQTLRQDGFLAEWGAHGFLDNAPDTQEMLQDLDLASEMYKAPLKRFKRHICLKGALTPLPQSPPQVLKTRLIPLFGKLRILADLWKKPRPEEQTAAQWAAYRFGRSILPLADIALTGTFAGDMEKLSVNEALPGLRKLELEHGSVIRGAIKTIKKKSGSGMPSMISFKQGMEYLPAKLAQNKTIFFKSAVKKLSREQDNWLIETEDNSYKAGQIILALPVNRALPLLNDLLPSPRPSIPEARIINVTMGFQKNAEIPFGFGYLAPKTEKRFALGALFPTHMFPQRAPENLKSLEALVGGTRNPESLDMEDKDIVSETLADLKQLMPLPDPPVFTRVLRNENGIPQMETGHDRLRQYRQKVERENPGLHICGFGWEGIGINDVVKPAKKAAAKLAGSQDRQRDKDAVKGVYF